MKIITGFFKSFTNRGNSSIDLPSVKIGNLIWATKNLNVGTFRNGDPIPEVESDDEWRIAGIQHRPASCNYKNDRANGSQYGKLYNWHTVNDPRGLAPNGWHIATEDDWKNLWHKVEGKYKGGRDSLVGLKLKSAYGWYENRNGSNKSGFAGLPGGFRNGNGDFWNIGEEAKWWGASLYPYGNSSYAYSFSLEYDKDNLDMGRSALPFGCSVRCVRD